MKHPDRTSIHRMRQLFITWFPYLVRLFEHLTETADPDALSLLINETLYEQWPSERSEWILRGAVRRARSFSRQRTGHCERYPLSPLPFDERTVIYLAYTGYSRLQVASIIGIPSEDVDALLRQGRKRLRRLRGGCLPGKAPTFDNCCFDQKS